MGRFVYAIASSLVVGVLIGGIVYMLPIMPSLTKGVEDRAATRMEVLIMCFRNNQVSAADYNGIENCRQAAYLQVPRQDQ